MYMSESFDNVKPNFEPAAEDIPFAHVYKEENIEPESLGIKIKESVEYTDTSDIETFTKLFPFIERYIPAIDLKFAILEPFTADVLNLKAKTEINTEAKHPIERIVLLDNEGNELIKVGERETKQNPKWYEIKEWLLRNDFKETVGEALTRLTTMISADFFKYILVMNNGEKKIVLYQLPENTTFNEWIKS
jgi:hypothetical protein